ncbi:MAG: glycosyltransferase family 1 protein [Phycisphaeraceae bacterium]
MRIAIYSSPIDSIAKPTGVGRHIASMATELAQLEDVEPVLLTSRASYENIQPHLNGVLSAIPVRYLPGPERLSRAVLLGSRWFSVDRWAGPVDWVYSPKEQPVATRHAKLAVTLHDVLPFERDVPGLPATATWSRRRWQMTMKRMLRRADLIATVSQFTRSRLLTLFDGFDEDRIEVIGNGIAPVFFRSAAADDERVLDEYGLARHSYVVTVGSLTHRKNGPALLRLAKLLHEQGAGLEILVAGRRHDEDLVQEHANLCQQNPNFPLRLLGYVPDDDLAAMLTHALVMLFPSRYEGFGIPVLEAMAAGAPVIGSRAAALPEVMGGAGLEVEGQDEQEIFDMITNLQGDAALRGSLIARGLDRVAEFTWRRCAERLKTAMDARS